MQEPIALAGRERALPPGQEVPRVQERWGQESEEPWLELLLLLLLLQQRCPFSCIACEERGYATPPAGCGYAAHKTGLGFF